MEKTNKSEAETLHQKAEELLKKKSLKTDSQLSETDILRLNRKLQVHQIELEMQNEELKLAYKQAVERNQAEEALKESEERFRTLFENSTIGIYRTTPDGQILLANPSLIKLLGYSSFEELADRNLAQDGFEPSFERTHFIDIIKREGEVKGLESAWTRMDGTTVFISESAQGINDKEGKIIYYDGIVEDITLRKQAEEKLRKSEQMLQKVLDNFPGVVFWKDRHSNYLGCNQAFATGAGLNSPAEIVGKTDLNLPWASTEAISYRKDDLDVMENGKERLHIVEMQHQSDGQVIWFDTSKFALRDSLGQVIGVIGVSNDISMLKIAEQELINTNKELAYQNREKEKRTAELVIANKELTLAIDNEKLTKEKYIELYNFAPTGYLTLTREGKIIELNQFTSQILGKKLSFLRDHWFCNFVSDDTKSIFNDFLGQVFKGKTKQICDITLLTDSDLPKYVYLSGIVIKNAEQCLITIDDISERKHIENALYESEEKYSKAFQSSPYSITITSAKDSKFIEVNDAFTQISGFTREEALANSTFGLNLWVNEEEQKWVISTLLDGKDIAGKEFSFKKKNGEIITGLFSTKIIKLNNEHCVISSINDITERKQAEEALELSEKKYRDLTELLPLCIFETDLEGNFTYANKTALESFGYDISDFAKGINIIQIISPEDTERATKNFQNSFMSSIHKPNEYLALRKDDSCFPSLIHSNPIIENGNTIGIRGYIIDQTERKQTEFELIKAKEKAEESDRLKSAFLTNMSHEIRTPMNGILVFAELLKEPNLSSDDQQDFIQTIQISGERMLDTINSIVDISKIESGLMKVDIKETNINEKIEFAYKFFKPEVEIKGLQFLFKNGLPTKEAIIKTDNEKVYGMLINLIKNAIKFTNVGSIEFGYEKKGESLEFYVKDSGIGIPENQKEMIFERFRQGSESYNRRYEGSGLGLSIAKSYVKMLGGKIWVESQEGKGSTFYFTIPYNPVSEETYTIENVGFDEDKEVQMKKLKILVVEDDEISYSGLTKILQKISKEVLHAVTGVQAVEVCRNNPDIDLVLMDIRMPKMDGNEATRQIRQFNKDVIIIAQTAYAFVGDSEKAIEAGCNDYISKPIKSALLYELIKKHLSNRN